MTSYRLKIDSANDVEYISLNSVRKLGSDPNEWTAIIPAKDTTPLIMGAKIDIYRDEERIYAGILEKNTQTMGSEGSTKSIGGRGMSVLLWRKWIERQVDYDGYWSAYYPNKIIEFLLHPSISEYDPTEMVTRIGWGINPAKWELTSSPDSMDGKIPNDAASRMELYGFVSGRNQTTGDYLQVYIGDTAKDIIGIRFTCMELNFNDMFLRNYSIQISPDGESWTTVVLPVYHSKALNVVESWDASDITAQTKYVRITCEGNWAKPWAVSELYLYKNDIPIDGLYVGNIQEYLPFNVSRITSDVNAGATTIEVEDGWKFVGADVLGTGHYIVVGDDDSDEGVRSYGPPVNHLEVMSVTGNTITLRASQPLLGSYKVSKNAYVLNYSGYTPLDLDYQRRSDAVDAIVGKMLDADEMPWVWEVDFDGYVNVGPRFGTDMSSFVSFVRGQNLIKSSYNTDTQQKIDRVLVIGRGQDDAQDRTSSGWVGEGDYEHVEIDSTATAPESSMAKAKTMIAQNATSFLSFNITVRDDYPTGTWGLDDDVTIIDSVSGFNGPYRVKSINRSYSGSGEVVMIDLINTTKSIAKTISDMMNNIRSSRTSDTKQRFPGIYNDPSYILKFEAEYLASTGLYRTIITDKNASNSKYIKIAYPPLGSSTPIFSGPGTALSPGKYKAVFVSKVTDNTSTNAFIELAVESDEYGGLITTLTLNPSSYIEKDVWQPIYLPFSLNATYHDIKFVAQGFGFEDANIPFGIPAEANPTDWSCDFIGIQMDSSLDTNQQSGAQFIISVDESTNMFTAYRDDGSLQYTNANLKSILASVWDINQGNAKWVHFKGGDYYTPETIDNTPDDAKITGDGMEAVRIIGTQAVVDGVFKFKNDRGEFYDFTVDCNYGFSYGIAFTGDGAGKGYSNMCTRVQVLNAALAGFEFNGSNINGHKLEWCKSKEHLLYGVDIHNTNTDIWIFGGTFSVAKYNHNYSAGIRINATGIQCLDNHIWGNDYGYILADESTVEQLSIIGDYIESNVRHNILMGGKPLSSVAPYSYDGGHSVRHLILEVNFWTNNTAGRIRTLTQNIGGKYINRCGKPTDHVLINGVDTVVNIDESSDDHLTETQPQWDVLDSGVYHPIYADIYAATDWVAPTPPSTTPTTHYAVERNQIRSVFNGNAWQSHAFYREDYYVRYNNFAGSSIQMTRYTQNPNVIGGNADSAAWNYFDYPDLLTNIGTTQTTNYWTDPVLPVGHGRYEGKLAMVYNSTINEYRLAGYMNGDWRHVEMGPTSLSSPAVPIEGIIMWSGSVYGFPDNFTLCNGVPRDHEFSVTGTGAFSVTVTGIPTVCTISNGTGTIVGSPKPLGTGLNAVTVLTPGTLICRFEKNVATETVIAASLVGGATVANSPLAIFKRITPPDMQGLFIKSITGNTPPAPVAGSTTLTHNVITSKADAVLGSTTIDAITSIADHANVSPPSYAVAFIMRYR